MSEEYYLGSIIKIRDIGPRRRVEVYSGGFIQESECVWITGQNGKLSDIDEAIAKSKPANSTEGQFKMTRQIF